MNNTNKSCQLKVHSNLIAMYPVCDKGTERKLFKVRVSDPTILEAEIYPHQKRKGGDDVDKLLILTPLVKRGKTKIILIDEENVEIVELRVKVIESMDYTVILTDIIEKKSKKKAKKLEKSLKTPKS
jgi:hypothetical protein